MPPVDAIGTNVTGSVHYLHVPDGFLNTAVSLLCWLITIVVLAIALRKAQAAHDERLVPLAGVMAAFIFAAQMINFPVAGGTSGHLLGATLAFMVLGPWLGLLVMTAVITLQALLFQDGGLLTMGANILIMGIVPGFVGYGVYQLTAGRERRLKLVAAGVAAWLSVVAGAFVTAVLLGISGTANLALVVPLMVGVHVLIGVGEALITVAALTFVSRTRPQLMGAAAPANGGRWLLAGIGIIILILMLSPFASSSPDGLEWVAQQQAFIDRAVDAPFAILPDYTTPFLGDGGFSTIVAGLVGVVLVAVFVIVVSRLIGKRHDQQQRPS